MSDDQEKLIRDLSHLGRVLSERVHDLEDQLEQCKRVFEALQRRVRQETKRHD
jgi:chaperonin cofactor prefoldin